MEGRDEQAELEELAALVRQAEQAPRVEPEDRGAEHIPAFVFDANRLALANAMMARYPGKLPVIAMRLPDPERPDFQVPNPKFFTPQECNLRDFVRIFIRSSVGITRRHTLRLYAMPPNDGSVITAGDTMQSVYNRCHSPDAFLYLWISALN